MGRTWGGTVPQKLGGVYFGAVWKTGGLAALCCQGLGQLDLGGACWGELPCLSLSYLLSV